MLVIGRGLMADPKLMLLDEMSLGLAPIVINELFKESHELEVECVLRSGDPSEVIVAYAGECEADLLIMGAYGHTKVRELVVGSTTAYALSHAPCPLLLSR